MLKMKNGIASFVPCRIHHMTQNLWQIFFNLYFSCPENFSVLAPDKNFKAQNFTETLARSGKRVGRV